MRVAWQTFVKLAAGETKTVSWLLTCSSQPHFHAFVASSWRKAYSRFIPRPLQPLEAGVGLDDAAIKAQIANFWRQSYVYTPTLCGFNCAAIDPASCKSDEVWFETGYGGCVLLNAYHCLIYGEEVQDRQLISIGTKVLKSYLDHGFAPCGLLLDLWHQKKGQTDGGPGSDGQEPPHYFCMRRQAEGVYALLLFLAHERLKGRRSVGYEKAVEQLLQKLIRFQKVDGSFPRAVNAEGKVHSAPLAPTDAC